MFKNGFFYITILMFVLSGLGCSSSNESGEDLDISEIQEIEATGEFSEDEFFSDEGEIELAEEELVEDVPGLEAELEGEVAKLEGNAGDEFDLDLDLSEEVSSNVEEGADLFDDLDLDDEEEAIGAKKNVTITADDLDLGDELDLDEELASVETDEFGEEELSLDSEEDLFRDSDISVEDSFSEEVAEVQEEAPAVEDVTIDVDYSDQIAENNTQSAAETLAEDVSIDDIDYAAEVKAVNAVKTAASFIPVKKMKTVPYSKNGVLVNAIYFVRDGDSLRGIANKIYGSGSGVDFRIVNPHLREGALKVGQKIYYNSPVRSQDRSRLLTYYEDVRVPVKTYRAKAGENIRTVAKELLGHPRSWMEIWASNQQIESKGSLESEHRVRYWNGQPTPVPVLAKVTPEPKKIEPVKKEIAKANLDLVEDKVSEEVASEEIEEIEFDEPDMELEDPAEVVEDDFEIDEEDLLGEEVLDEVASEEIVEPAGQDEILAEEEPSAVVADVREIARNNGGGAFPQKTSGGLALDPMRLGVLGVALLMLLIVGFLVVKRRRDSQSAVEIDSFDFGGETTIDEAQTKTQIDL